MKKLNNYSIIIFYLVVFSLVLLPGWHGIGNYWDWSFPYFHKGLRYFAADNMAWNLGNLGGPVTYASSYLFNGFLGLLGHLAVPPESVIYLLLVVLTAVSAFGVYQIAKKISSNKLFAILLGLVAVLNPGIEYKLLAGHTNYLFSYAVFIWLICFLFFDDRKFEKSIAKKAFVLILMALLGTQLQFYFFIFLLVAISLFFIKPRFKLVDLILFALVPLIVNSPWLIHLVVGANSLGTISKETGAIAFAGSMFASPIRVALMVFSPATNIQFLFPKYIFVGFGLVNLAMLSVPLLAHRLKKLSPEIKFWGTCWVVLLLLATGYFHKLPVPILKQLYPLFREIGHFAPVTILVGLILLAHIPLFRLKKYLNGASILLVIFIAVSTISIIRYLPTVDYNQARAKFDKFDKFNSTDDEIYRTLTYPFWNQYGFLDARNQYQGDKLLNNSGMDSFMNFSGHELISNYASGSIPLSRSVQYQLLHDYDISGLVERNVKYIYDFSKIYQSNFEKYCDPSIYSNDISLIKNDPKFQQKLLEANPGKLTRVNDEILQINQVMPRINGKNVDFERIDTTLYKVSIKNISAPIDLTFLESFSANWRIYSARDYGGHDIKGIAHLVSSRDYFSDSHTEIYGYGNKWQVEPQAIGGVKNNDGSYNLDLILFYRPQAYYQLAKVIAYTTIVILALISLSFGVMRRWPKKSD